MKRKSDVCPVCLGTGIIKSYEYIESIIIRANPKRRCRLCNGKGKLNIQYLEANDEHTS